jgi:RNA polymerase sigma-70 factor (ECF subfamily)
MQKYNNDHGRSAIFDVFNSVESGLKQYIMRFLVHPQDVEDALQETLLRSWESEKKQDIHSPKSFLYKVARNIALSEISRKARHLTVYIGDIDELNVIEGEVSLERSIEIDERLRSLSSVIESLPPQCQRVFIMRKVFGFSHREIARRLKISTRTVEQHLTKGLKRCQDSMPDSTAERDGLPDWRTG